MECPSRAFRRRHASHQPLWQRPLPDVLPRTCALASRRTRDQRTGLWRGCACAQGLFGSATPHHRGVGAWTGSNLSCGSSQHCLRNVENGGLLTEHPRGVRPFAGNFVRRNRIVAGMADATIVIESADHGGALITARLAGEYNRTVCAFPGRTTDKFSEGCLHLIRQRRAELVTSATDVLELLNWIEPAQPDAPVQLELFGPQLTPDQQVMARVLQDNDGCTLSQLMLHTGFDLPKINTLVFELEMLNCISLSSGNCYRWKPQ